MVERLRSILVESFVGAIGIGFLLSQMVGHFANTLAYSASNWLVQSSSLNGVLVRRFQAETIIVEFVRGVVLLLVGYLLLYWLYFPKSAREEQDDQPPETTQYDTAGRPVPD